MFGNFFKKVISVTKAAIIIMSIYFIVISLFAYFIDKDRAFLVQKVDPIIQNREEIYKVINDKEMNSTKEGKFSIAIYRGIMCNMIGEACTDNPEDGDRDFDKSTFGFITKLIVTPLANPPASGVFWAYDGLQSAGFIPKTYAAEGVGFAAIKPFANIWKIFRDLSYMLLVMVLIAIGFMIMFRMKMNPQTVISVENALPRIIVALILITFSFAIAGFLIDIMYISIGLITSLFIKDPAQATTFKNEYMLSQLTDIFRDVRVRFGSRSIGTVLGSAMIQILPIEANVIIRGLSGFLTIFLTNWFIVYISDSASSLLGLAGVAGGTFSVGEFLKAFFSFGIFPLIIIIIFLFGFVFLLPLIVSLLIGFSILFLAFRIIFLLFTSYLKLIINIVIAPLLLLFEAIPGRSTFKFWILNIVGNLIVYPIMIFVFLLSYIIIFGTNHTDMTARLPYLYGLDSNSFRLLIGLGLIFLIPDLVKATKEALGIKELPFTIGIGTFFGGVSTAAGGGVGLLGQIGSISLGISGIGQLRDKGKEFFGALAKPKSQSAPPAEPGA